MSEPRVPDQAPGGPAPDVLTRRSFLKGASTVAAAGSVLSTEVRAAQPQTVQDGPKAIAGETRIELVINGEPRKVVVEPRTTLLSALRHRLEPALTGSKEVCDRGNCGACTVSIDGMPAYSCMQLAVDMQGRDIRTIEGLGEPDALSPVQDAFCQHDASMCGFCTPGFVMSTTVCLERNPDADLDTIKRDLAGNICRCGTYPHIFDAAQDARERMRKGR